MGLTWLIGPSAEERDLATSFYRRAKIRDASHNHSSNNTLLYTLLASGAVAGGGGFFALRKRPPAQGQ